MSEVLTHNFRVQLSKDFSTRLLELGTMWRQDPFIWIKSVPFYFFYVF